MTLSNLLPLNPLNFHNLALFVCHLFADGQFRFGHILYDSSALDSRLIAEIHSVCPYLIPWISNDVSELPSVPWEPNQRTDHILQLIFFDPENIPMTIDHVKKSNVNIKLMNFLTFYRIFVISSDDVGNRVDWNSIAKLSSHILHHDSRSGSISLHSIKNDDGVIEGVDRLEMLKQYPQKNRLKHCDKSKKCDNLFSLTFGKNEKNVRMIIKRTYLLPCNREYFLADEYFEVRNGNPFFANFYFTHLNASFINVTAVWCENSTIAYKSEPIQPQPRKFYKELPMDYKPMDSVKL